MATPATVPLTIYVKRDYVLEVNERTALGNPWDLRGYTIVFGVKVTATDLDSHALYLSSSFYDSDLAVGHYRFLIPHTTTSGSGYTSNSVAVHEIVYQDPNGIINTRYTGPVTLVQPVIQSFPV